MMVTSRNRRRTSPLYPRGLVGREAGKGEVGSADRGTVTVPMADYEPKSRDCKVVMLSANVGYGPAAVKPAYRRPSV